jgi:catalase
LVPEELAPVEIVGRMTLNRNPTNYFAETEQVAFCTAHIPRGIDFTDDPLLQARNFSYLDTQLSRLGGPNFDQLPINRPQSPVHTNQRDGFGQQAVAEGVAAYTPNSLGGGCPFTAGAQGLVHVPRQVSGKRVRARAQSFDDHFSQATLFWESMTPPEREHIVGAFSFELGKCLSEEVKDRVLANLAQVDAGLVKAVAANLGKETPKGRASRANGKATRRLSASPARSLAPTEPGPIWGRVVGILAADGVDDAGVRSLSRALESEGAAVVVIAPHGGMLPGNSETIEVTKSAMTTQSVEYDALVVAGGPGADTLHSDPYVAVNLGEAFRHYKPIAAWGEGCDVLEACGIAADSPGVVMSERSGRPFANKVIEAIGWHRHWERTPS